MTVVRLEERTSLYTASVGEAKVLATVLALAQRGFPLNDRDVIAKECGLTVAILNYYFGDQSISEKIILHLQAERSEKRDC